MLRRFNDLAEAVLARMLAVMFAAMICVVFAQVAARNVFKIPLIWTLDAAQLLFAWCIFIGAAVAFRRGSHYIVDLWRASGPGRWILVVAPAIASAIVIYVLFWHGIAMSQIGLSRLSPSLGISEFWFFLPIPLGGAFMALFLVEDLLGRRRA